MALTLLAAGSVQAHPLGNDSITHFNVLYVLPDRLEVDYLLDIAENPSAFFETNEMDADGDGQVTRQEQDRWLDVKVEEFSSLLTARLNGEDLKMAMLPERLDAQTGRRLSTSKIIVPMLGPMGMTYRLVVRYVAPYPSPLDAGEHVISFEDKTYPQHVGLKLVLLEPPSPLCRIFDLDEDDLIPGPVPEVLAEYLDYESLPLQHAETARLERAPPGTAGEPRWRLIDGESSFALIARDGGIDLHYLPYCEVLEPHPPFVSEDNAVFQYEQYDPVNLPDVRSASIRFSVFGNDGPVATVPQDPQGSGQSESTPVRATATQPADHADLPSYATAFLDPATNQGQADEYQRQARRMIGLLQGEWSLVLLCLVTITAFGWGAAHALMPGHAKTVVAAYLISQRGTYRHAAMLAVIVTITHTALVVLMGLIIWYFQETNPRLAPHLQLWLGLLAGLLVAGMGLTLMWRALSGRIASHGHDHDHDHGHGHDHAHDDRSWWRKLFTHSHPHLPEFEHEHEHSHGHDHSHHHEHAHAHVHAHSREHEHAHAHAHVHDHNGHVHDHGYHHHDHGPGHAHVHAPARQGDLSYRMILLLGITGGIVPCPSATIIMFLGIGYNVVGGALYAIAVFSLGLALTLMVIGSLALASRRFAARIMSDARHEHELSGPGRRLLLQIVPAFSGLAVICLGGMIAVHYICLMRNVSSPFPWMG